MVPKMCGMLPKMSATAPKMCGMVPKMCGRVPKMCGTVPKRKVRKYPQLPSITALVHPKYSQVPLRSPKILQSSNPQTDLPTDRQKCDDNQPNNQLRKYRAFLILQSMAGLGRFGQSGVWKF